MKDTYMTKAGEVRARFYDDGCAKGVEILLNGEIVCMFDVMEHPTEGGTRLIVYAEKSEDEPTHTIEIHKEEEK